jgi:hypothetical protein
LPSAASKSTLVVRPEATMDEHDPDEQDVEAYGLRVSHQSEAVRLEAAEFLVATRAQQEAKLRIAKNLEQLRQLDQTTD